MKKTTRFIFVCLLLLLSASIFIGCDGNEGTQGSDGNKKLLLEEIQDISEYKIVRPDKGEGAKEITLELRNALKEQLDIELKVGTDFYGATGKEILIGETSRSESKSFKEGLRASDFKIGKIGSKIVVVGGSDVGLERALEFVLKYCINTERKSFSVPSGTGYLGMADYVSDKITIDGVDIGEFKIVSDTYTELDSFALKIMNNVIGAELETTKVMSDESAHYIIIDNTDTAEDRFTITVEDGNIVIKASYNSADYALDYFCGTYLKDRGGKTVELKSGDSFEGSAGKKQIYSKEQLMAVLEKFYNDPDKFIVGQQAEQGGNPLPSVSLEKFEEAAGELPGMLGLDLGCYGMYIQKYTPQKWSRAICEIVDYAAAGGIVEISSHLDNPAVPSQYVRGKLGDVTTEEELNALFEELVTEGTELNAAFKKTLETDGRFLSDLRDNGVPVLWRPLHEMNGNWFWYSVTCNNVTADSEVWANVWRYIYDYYTNELGLDNLIWVYSPNVSDNEWDEKGGTMSTLYCYPGNEYCDMVGTDWYFSTLNRTTPAGYSEIIDVSGYIGALTEFGIGDDLRANAELNETQLDKFNCMDMNDFIENIMYSGSNVAYVLSWNGEISFSALGKADEFMALDRTVGAKELKTVFESMK